MSEFPNLKLPALFGSLSAVVTGTLLLVACPVQAHQLSDLRGTAVPHDHAYKRNSYGQGLTSGHVAPTRNGHDMIIWSPSPTRGFSAPRQQKRITEPRRPTKPRRASGLTRQIQPAGQNRLSSNPNRGR